MARLPLRTRLANLLAGAGTSGTAAPAMARLAVRAGLAVLLAGAGTAGIAAPVAAPPLPPPRPKAEPHQPDAPAPPGAAADEASCQARISRLGARFEVRPPIQEGACGGHDLVLLSGLPDGVAVSPPALMACPVAEALAHWSRDVVAVETGRNLGTALTKIRIGTSYECRDQRNGAKLSEHAFANGVDLMGFEFSRHEPLTIGSPAADTPESAFQDAVRRGACSHFTTVLGPGSDPAHGNHLHLDLRDRKAGYRICQ